jgi:hypothetical protein
MSSESKKASYIYSLLIGKLLGDGCITKQKGRKPRFQFIHATSDKEWCFYCYEQLVNNLPLSSPSYRRLNDSRTLNGYTECFQVQSRTDPIITWLESIWYHNRKKIIPFYLLEQYLDEQALAWWYQDDGHLSQKNNIPKKIILSTDNFTKIENRRLKGLLARKFSLYFNLDSQNRLILYDQLQIYYFLFLVNPFIHPSMERKKLIKRKQIEIKNKRTTIYLPVSIHLTKPTKQINEILINQHLLIKFFQDRNNYIKFYKHSVVQQHISIETKGYQIIINKDYLTLLYSIKNQTGLTISQIVSICFQYLN